FQRITAVSNFINGRPWNWTGSDQESSKSISKIPIKVDGKIMRKSFKELDDVKKRIITRSTVPVTEFEQNSPKNYDSKYLIFERINTGSEKLTPMQIRKSLSAGFFIKSLYEFAKSNNLFSNLFSYNARSKDTDVESY